MAKGWFNLVQIRPKSSSARKGRVLKDGAGVHPVSPGCELEFNWGLTPPAQDFYNYISHSSTLRGATRREWGANERDTGSAGGRRGDRFFCPLSRPPPSLPLVPAVERTQVMEETKNSPRTNLLDRGKIPVGRLMPGLRARRSFYLALQAAAPFGSPRSRLLSPVYHLYDLDFNLLCLVVFFFLFFFWLFHWNETSNKKSCVCMRRTSTYWFYVKWNADILFFC